MRDEASDSQQFQSFLDGLDKDFYEEFTTLDVFVKNEEILSSASDARELSSPIKESVTSDPRSDTPEFAEASLGGDVVSSLSNIKTPVQSYYKSTADLLYNIKNGVSGILSFAAILENVDVDNAAGAENAMSISDAIKNLKRADRVSYSDFYRAFEVSLADMLDIDQFPYSDPTRISALKFGDNISLTLDQYAMGVILGEYVEFSYMTEYNNGNCSLQDVLMASQAFCVWARSYGLYQTTYSKYHYKPGDHQIESGSTKQCFRWDLANIAQQNPNVLMMAYLASTSTSGQVLARGDMNYWPEAAYYRSDTNTPGRGSQKGLLRLAASGQYDDYMTMAMYPFQGSVPAQVDFTVQYPEGGFSDYNAFKQWAATSGLIKPTNQ